MGTEAPVQAGVSTGSVAHCVAMSGPFLVCDAVLKAPISVSVDCRTRLMCTLGCSFWYCAIIDFIQSFAPGASLSPQYQYVRVPAYLGSEPLPALPLLLPPHAATASATAAVSAAAASTPRVRRCGPVSTLASSSEDVSARASVHVSHSTGSTPIMVGSATCPPRTPATCSWWGI